MVEVEYVVKMKIYKIKEDILIRKKCKIKEFLFNNNEVDRCSVNNEIFCVWRLF